MDTIRHWRAALGLKSWRAKRTLVAWALISVFFAPAIALSDPVESDSTAKSEVLDPFLGDWEGQGIVAQVIPQGGDAYVVRLLPKFDSHADPIAVAEARRSGDSLSLSVDGIECVFRGTTCELTRSREGQQSTSQLTRVVRVSPTLGAKPPAGATVLFDGSDFSQWQVRGTDPEVPIVWKIDDGAMIVAPAGKESQPKQTLVSRQVFEDFRMHIEFYLPLMADKRGQARANGGVVFEDANWYELQVLDSYGLEGKDNECGGIYKVGAPAVNMCRPPQMWQTYDIVFQAPRYDQSGQRTHAGRVTVRHNGKIIHDDIELPDSSGAAREASSKSCRYAPRTYHAALSS